MTRLCFCGHRKVSHDDMLACCTIGRCYCLKFREVLGRPAHVREQYTPIAADNDLQRKTRLKQLVLNEW